MFLWNSSHHNHNELVECETAHVTIQLQVFPRHHYGLRGLHDWMPVYLSGLIPGHILTYKLHHMGLLHVA